ncbi:MAG: PEP/pyruvate-binding domain-containing protein, partial [Gemmataceae bacterium]
MTTAWILTFADAAATDPQQTGGKAATLARLQAAGFPVPPAFILTTAGTTVPTHQWADPVRKALAELSAGPVAVRSSAVAEDGTHTSFAGQQDTFLNILGAEAVIAAIEACLASWNSPRAVAYRQQVGTSAAPARAVLVQRMIDAEVAGVLFTRLPGQLQLPQMLVEAAWGLGESVVSGRVTPDHFILNAETGE